MKSQQHISTIFYILLQTYYVDFLLKMIHCKSSKCSRFSELRRIVNWTDQSDFQFTCSVLAIWSAFWLAWSGWTQKEWFWQKESRKRSETRIQTGKTLLYSIASLSQVFAHKIKSQKLLLFTKPLQYSVLESNFWLDQGNSIVRAIHMNFN